GLAADKVEQPLRVDEAKVASDVTPPPGAPRDLAETGSVLLRSTPVAGAQVGAVDSHQAGFAGRGLAAVLTQDPYFDTVRAPTDRQRGIVSADIPRNNVLSNHACLGGGQVVH